MALLNITKPVAGVDTADIFGTATTDDYLFGTSGDDIISGGAETIDYVTDGIDIMQGGAGDDRYIVNNSATGATDTVIEYANEGTDTVFTSVNYTLPSEVENIVATASATITLTGNLKDNILDGSQNTSANILKGMEGNDTYILGTGDRVIEGKPGVGTVVAYTDTGGIDTIISKLGTSIDLSTIIGQVDTAPALGTLSTTNRTAATGSIVGVAFIENVILDTTAGGAGITGNAKDNRLTGNDSTNTLTGNAGNDILDGGTNSSGSDTLVGGAGNDTYIVRNTGDTISGEIATGGIDAVISGVNVDLSTTSYVENITLTGISAINATGNNLTNVIKGNSGNNTLTGGAGNDTLYGLQGTDTLDGGLGNDIMYGGRGDDTYVVNSTSDVVTELADDVINGTDLVESSVSYTLNTAAAVGVENLTLTGTVAINATGNALDNTLIGNTGANILNGGTGADAMTGMTGNDTYIVDNASDTINETVAGSGGTDTVQSSVVVTGAGAAAGYVLSNYVENITLTGSAAINATGNTSANTMTGNAAANIMDGSTNNDKLIGNAGADTLTGGTGNDTITGSAGRDIVKTGDSADTGSLTESDTIVFAAGVTDTVATADSIAGVDLYSDLLLNSDANDLINITAVVANVGTAVNGAVTQATFVANMATALNKSGSGFNTAITGDISAAVVSATSGDLNGSDFLAVDLNKNNTFDATDFVIEITGSNFAALDVSTFI